MRSMARRQSSLLLEHTEMLKENSLYYKAYGAYIYVCVCIYIYSFIQLTQQLRQEQYVRYNYMFRPSKWTIIRLFTELVGRLYTRRGEYLGDEISSYFTVRGVNIGYQRYSVYMYVPVI